MKNYKKEKTIIDLYFLKILIFIFIFFFLYILGKLPSKSLNMKILLIEFQALVKEYKYLIKNEDNISDDSPIWVMWYQGIEKAPPIIKACIHSIFVNKANHPVYILDKNNLENYIKLPRYILKKFHKGIFSVTHFSDIIRMALLSKHGGYWIDSTYLVNSPINYTKSSLFTLKLIHCFRPKSKCLWAGNFLAMPKNSFLSTYAYNAFLFYWKKYNSLIKYFLIDHIISVAYESLPEIRNLIEKLPYIECNIFTLRKKLNNYYNESLFNCSFNKLSRRGKYISYIGKKITNYGFLISKSN